MRQCHGAATRAVRDGGERTRSHVWQLAGHFSPQDDSPRERHQDSDHQPEDDRRSLLAQATAQSVSRHSTPRRRVTRRRGTLSYGPRRPGRSADRRVARRPLTIAGLLPRGARTRCSKLDVMAKPWKCRMLARICPATWRRRSEPPDLCAMPQAERSGHAIVGERRRRRQRLRLTFGDPVLDDRRRSRVLVGSRSMLGACGASGCLIVDPGQPRFTGSKPRTPTV